MAKQKQVVIIVGSESDLHAINDSKMTEILNAMDISYEISAASAHRHGDELTSYCRQQLRLGTNVFIAVVGLSPGLPGAILAAINRTRPVIGVAVTSMGIPAHLMLPAIAIMPPDCPVAATGVDRQGLDNAAMLAAQIVAAFNPETSQLLETYLQHHTKSAQFDIALPLSRK